MQDEGRWPAVPQGEWRETIDTLHMWTQIAGKICLALTPQSVADFYRRVMETLHDMGIDVRIWTMPVEVPNPIRFEQDRTHHSYDPRAANTFWRMFLTI